MTSEWARVFLNFKFSQKKKRTAYFVTYMCWIEKFLMEIFSLFKKSLNDFLNEKLLKTSGNNAKVAGKGNFWMSYFKSVGICIKMKIIKKSSIVCEYMYKQSYYSKTIIFILGGHIRPILFVLLFKQNIRNSLNYITVNSYQIIS